MAYTDIDNPSETAFNTVLYTGNGSAGQAITGVGFQPDLTWIKNRSADENHSLTDSVRGVTKTLRSDTHIAETTDSQGQTAFGTDGFSVGSEPKINGSGNSIVAWNWKAGTAFSNDASSTGVGSIDSVGSINTTTGFSIITYNGTDGTETVAHGLGVAPDFIWFKRRNADKNNVAYHSALGNTKSVYPDNTSAASTNYDYFADTSPTSSVFTIKKDEDYTETNQSGGTYVAWCFAEKKGYSKFGSYIGNVNANGNFVYLGFKPAFVLVKLYGQSGSWWMWDNKRNTANPITQGLSPDTSNAESAPYTAAMDFLSNGFKIREGGSDINRSTGLIYMAFAEQPFVTSTGVPATAR
jgi:hypothetical protein